MSEVFFRTTSPEVLMPAAAARPKAKPKPEKLCPPRSPLIARLPAPENARENTILGRVTGQNAGLLRDFLPTGTGIPLVDELRNRHLAMLARVEAVLDERDAIRKPWGAQDADYTEALERAALDGTEPPDDDRPSEEERRQLLAPVRDRLFAALAALAIVGEETLEKLREAEDGIVDDFSAAFVAVQDEERELQRLLQAKVQERAKIARRVFWLRRATDASLPWQPESGIALDGFLGGAFAQVQVEHLPRSVADAKPWNRQYEDPAEQFPVRDRQLQTFEEHAQAVREAVQKEADAPPPPGALTWQAALDAQG